MDTFNTLNIMQRRWNEYSQKRLVQNNRQILFAINESILDDLEQTDNNSTQQAANQLAQQYDAFLTLTAVGNVAVTDRRHFEEEADNMPFIRICNHWQDIVQNCPFVRDCNLNASVYHYKSLIKRIGKDLNASNL